MAEEITNSQSLALTCDGWSNIRNESIVNFIITTPEPLLFKTLPIKSERHTGKFMAESIMHVIEEATPDPLKVLDVVTDNEISMVNDRTKVQSHNLLWLSGS